jgi:hypothetical protein
MLSGGADGPERALRSAEVFVPKALLVSHLLTYCLRLPNRTRVKLDRYAKTSG